MLRFTVSRIGQMALTVLIVLTFIFVVVTVLPGDPARALFGFAQPPQRFLDAIVQQFHLDEPLWVQYLLYLRDLATGDLGRSFPVDPFGDPTSGPLVSSVIAAAVPVSGRILLGALLAQMVIGIGAGVLAALRPWSRSSTAVYAGALLLVSIPVLVAAYVTRGYLALGAGWFPVAGVHAGWTSYVLPSISLAALSIGYVALLTRFELLDVMREPFIKAARARGLSDRRVVGVHALRASLVPVITFIAANVGQLLTGLIIVEGVFGIPGIGGQVFAAIQERDRALLVGLVTVIAVAVIVVNTIADLLYAVIDPRIRVAA